MKNRVSNDENHEVIASQQQYNQCARNIELPKDSQWYMYSQMPVPCVSKGKKVLVMKSTPKDSYPADYDYRVSYIDAETYADYQIDFYKDGKLVKEIVKNWLPIEMPMPRAQVFSHWYVINHTNQTETLMVMQPLEKPTNPQMWTDAFLRKTKR
jgi:hypothetical protein